MRPRMVLRMVDLPAPLGPRMPKKAPKGTSNSTPERTVLFPYPREACLNRRTASSLIAPLSNLRRLLAQGREQGLQVVILDLDEGLRPGEGVGHDPDDGDLRAGFFGHALAGLC